MFIKIKKRIIFIFLVIKHKIKYLFSKNKNPIYNTGIHFIEGLSGSGKTLLANYIIQETTNNIDNCFFYSNINQFKSNSVKTIDFFSLFEDGKVVKKLPAYWNNKYCYALIVDELNANFNRRLNNRKEYNDIFIGLMQFAVLHRHQKIPRIYFLGQSLDLQDRQVQSIFKYKHEVKSVKRYSFAKYQDTNDVVRLPKRIVIEHSIKSDLIDAKGNNIFIPFKN